MGGAMTKHDRLRYEVRSVTEIRHSRKSVEVPFHGQKSGGALEVTDIEELSTLIINAVKV